MQGEKVIIKVCGMREGNNIRQVESAGPDLMGFICWPGSKRHVAEKPCHLPACKRVGVFVDPTLEQITAARDMLGLDYMQLHGHESPEDCQRFAEATGLKVIKAISVHDREDVQRANDYRGVAQLLVFDTKCKCIGGSGQQFDWGMLQCYTGSTPFLLSGGIGPEDAERLRGWNHPQCMGIDINSRFETSPAVKDERAVKEFIRKIKKS